MLHERMINVFTTALLSSNTKVVSRNIPSYHSHEITTLYKYISFEVSRNKDHNRILVSV